MPRGNRPVVGRPCSRPFPQLALHPTVTDKQHTAVDGCPIGQGKHVGRLDRSIARVAERLLQPCPTPQAGHLRPDVHRRQRQTSSLGLQDPKTGTFIGCRRQVQYGELS